MSNWTYINGVISVDPFGRTQAESRYIVETVLNHLPVIKGSETDMQIYINQSKIYADSYGCDEFEQQTNNLTDEYGRHTMEYGYLNIYKYQIIVEGKLRDTYFDDTYRNFMKWLCRLSKRLYVDNVCVEIHERYTDKEAIIIDKNGEVYGDLFEYSLGSMGNENNEPTWTDYLRWERAENSTLPKLLEQKYCKKKNEKGKNPIFVIKGELLFIEFCLINVNDPECFVCIDNNNNRYLVLLTEFENNNYLITPITPNKLTNMICGKISIKDLFGEADIIYSVKTLGTQLIDDENRINFFQIRDIRGWFKGDGYYFNKQYIDNVDKYLKKLYQITTNFDKFKSMTQNEVSNYIKNELCKIYKDCDGCPMYYYGCLKDEFVEWLESPVKETKRNH